MTVEMKLLTLKFAHTVVVAANAAGILYTIYCGLTGRFTLLLWLAVGLSALIAVGLAVNDFICPLQTLARRIVGVDAWTADLFMPNWAAYLIAPVLGPLMAVGYGLIGWRLWRRGRGDRGGRGA
jgi:hypothetical protein